MNEITEHDQAVQKLSVNDLRKYLTAHGWFHAQSDKPLSALFTHVSSAGSSIRIAVPNNDDFDDSRRRIADAIRTLAAVERRPGLDVACDISRVSNDILMWRVPGDMGEGIPMDIAAKLVHGVEELFTYSASTEPEPRPVVGRRTKAAQQFLSQCMLGHTKPGSFIFEFVTPIDVKMPSAFYSQGAPPFGRRVMQRIVRGLLDVNKAAGKNDPQSIIENYKEGFNANLCEALAAMLDDNEMACEFQVRWSPELSPRQDLMSDTFVRVMPTARDVLWKASAMLRKVTPYSQDTLRGRIIRLGDAPDGTTRTITLVADVDGYEKRVSLRLDPADYALACDAHRDSRRIQISGTLDKSGRKLMLLNVYDLKII